MIRVNSQSAGNLSDDGTNNDTSSGATQNMFRLPRGHRAQVDSSVGQIVFSSADGTNVSVDWMAEDNDADGIEALRKDCVFTGTIRVRPQRRPQEPRASRRRVADRSRASSALASSSCLQTATATDQDVFADPGVDHSMIHYNGQAGDAASHGSENDLDPDPAE